MQGLLLFIALAISQLSDPHVSQANNITPLMKDYIAAEATLEGVRPDVALTIVSNESHFNTKSQGDFSTTTDQYTSFGMWQFHLPAWNGKNGRIVITKDMAENPVWSTEYALKLLKDGQCHQWSTCPLKPGESATTTPADNSGWNIKG